MSRAPSLDPARFPRTAAYLAALPLGLESFPGCSVRGDVFEPFVRDFSDLATEPGVPAPIADLLAGRLNPAEWVSEVTFQAANLVVRDLAFASEASFRKWTYDISQELFDKPIVRTLMRLMSPTLVIVGATKRWGTFHRGSVLSSSPVTEQDGRVRAMARLTFPEGLFPRLYLEGLEQAFLAAVSGARAKDARVELGDVQPTSAEYRVSFRA